MTEPDPETIRMIGDCMRFQNPLIEAPPVPIAYDHYVLATEPQMNPSDLGVEGARGFDLDAEEPAAMRAPWPT